MSHYKGQRIKYEVELNDAIDKWFEARPRFARNRRTIFIFASGFGMAWESLEKAQQGKVLVSVEPSREATLKKALQELYDYSGPPINQEWLSAMEKARELLKEAT